MVASEMGDAEYENTSVEIEAAPPAAEAKYLFRTSSTRLEFPGFTALYIEGRDEAEDNEDSRALPQLKVDEQLKLSKLTPEQHFTQPPPRYTEATLVKALEQKGIGRPSTYAPILSTIQDREYVIKDKAAFKPTELGFVVNDMLTKSFP